MIKTKVAFLKGRIFSS